MPVTVLEATVSVIVEDPEPGAAIEAGLKLAVVPVGRPDALKDTAELNPPETVVLMVLVPEVPCVTLTEVGDALMAKVGVLVPHVGNLKDPMRVLQLKLPVAFKYSVVYQNVQSSAGSTVMLL